MHLARLLTLLILAAPAIAYESNPGATHTLLLDFGHFQTTEFWPYRAHQGPVNGNAPYTSPDLFPQDHPEQMDQDEQDDFIFRVWRRVAEDFAPFDVNVVTEEPSNFASLMQSGVAARIAVGGTGDEIGGGSRAPGYGYLLPELSRVALARGRDDYGDLRTETEIARTISHEASHIYGANYHYVDVWSPETAWCLTDDAPAFEHTHDTPGLEHAHLSRYANQDRDGWWSGRSAGLDVNQNSQCKYSSDFAHIRDVLGMRVSAVAPSDRNPLVRASANTLVGQGVVTYSADTFYQDQWVECLNDPNCATTGGSEFHPVSFGITVGKGPNSWIFKASSGSIRITVNTINRDIVPGVSPPVFIDTTSANLHADFSLWVANASDLSSWTKVLDSADPLAGDHYSAQKIHYPSGSTQRTYVVHVRSREGYARLGQYGIEVYNTGSGLEVYSPASLDTPSITIPGFTPKVPLEAKKTTAPTLTIKLAPTPKTTPTVKPAPKFSFSTK